MRLPFIGEVVTREHHEAVVAELKQRLQTLETEKWIAFNRLFETVQGMPLNEAIHQAGEPARADELAPHQKLPERPQNEEDAFAASRLGSLLKMAGRKASKVVRHTNYQEMSSYNKADEKRKVAEMFKITKLQAVEDAEKAQRARDLAEAGQDKPSPGEATGGD